MMQRLALIGLVTSFCLWAACAAWNVGGQRSLFCEEGRTLLCDYWMPRTCLDEGYAEVGDKFVVSTCLWLVVLCPLQLMLAGHSANGPLCNACLVALCAVTAHFRLWRFSFSGQQALRCENVLNPIAGSEAAFGMEAVCFPDGLISPTAFRASQMRASAISVVEEELELH